MEKNKLKLGKKLWLYLAIGGSVLVLAAGIVTTALILNRKPPVEIVTPDPDPEPSDPDPDVPVDVVPEPTYITPVQAATVLHSYGFYYNSTLQNYYEHTGIDFAAEAGATVLAVADGEITAITKGDVLLGNQLTVEHANGVTSVYTFLDVKDTLEVGDIVEQGQVIGSVSAATGEEYRDGAHLHYEIYVAGALADPDQYLSLEEK